MSLKIPKPCIPINLQSVFLSWRLILCQLDKVKDIQIANSTDSNSLLICLWVGGRLIFQSVKKTGVIQDIETQQNAKAKGGRECTPPLSLQLGYSKSALNPLSSWVTGIPTSWVTSVCSLHIARSGLQRLHDYNTWLLFPPLYASNHDSWENGDWHSFLSLVGKSSCHEVLPSLVVFLDYHTLLGM